MSLKDKLLEIEREQGHDQFLWNPHDSRYVLSGVGEGTIQSNVKNQYGMSDLEPYSRTSTVCDAVSLVENCTSFLDICCGDAYILTSVKTKFPKISSFGIDVKTYKYHKEAKNKDVQIFNIPIQRLVEVKFPSKFDIVMMLNTYRGWEYSRLKNQGSFEEKMNLWFKDHANNLILTAHPEQIKKLNDLGFNSTMLGKGEQDSFMYFLRG